MKVLGRPPHNVVRGLLRLPEFLVACAACCRVFEKPFQVLAAYVRRRSPAAGLVRLRNGWTIQLSSDPADIVTVVTVFARRDYGLIARDAVVVDVGANIGVFALWAGYCGAKRVIAIEPSAESFACLERNVRENGLSRIVLTRRLAVASRERRSVCFPRRSDVMNVMAPDDANGDVDEVPATSLDATLEPLGPVDLVKIDCEGAEYEILLGARPEAFRRVSALRLEYHRGRRSELIDCLATHGFEPTRVTAANRIGGVIWFRRAGRLAETT